MEIVIPLFFHVSTLVRRHKNKIQSLKNSVGEWTTNEEEVKNLILSGFQELFEAGLLTSSCDFEVTSFSCNFLSEEEGVLLTFPVLKEEIMQGLWALKPFKAPGPDGPYAGFFQYFWADIKHSVCKEITNIFEKRVILDYLNETLISLIPKCPSPESLNNFRPISLCNSMYKNQACKQQRKLIHSSSRAGGSGSWTRYQESSTSFGFVITEAYLLGRPLTAKE